MHRIRGKRFTHRMVWEKKYLTDGELGGYIAHLSDCEEDIDNFAVQKYEEEILINEKLYRSSNLKKFKFKLMVVICYWGPLRNLR